MSNKERFVDEASLQSYIASHIAEITTQVKAAVGPLEAEYHAKIRQRNSGFLSIIIGGVLIMPPIFLLDDRMPEFAVWIGYAAFAVFIFGVGMIWKGLQKMKGTAAVIAQFELEVDRVVFPLVLALFGVERQQVQVNALASELVLQLLETSELITEPKNTVTHDDVLSFPVLGKNLTVAELDVRHITGSGKNRREKHIFRGYFAVYKLDKTLQGKTFVSTEGDKHGFGHQSFWASLVNKELSATTLEWNEFEELLHVATTDPTEARYILTPDFMLDLHEWWKTKKGNIRISFIQHQLCMLFPDSRIRLNTSVKNLTETELEAYIHSLALPLLHVVHLVEDVTKQTHHQQA